MASRRRWLLLVVLGGALAYYVAIGHAQHPPLDRDVIHGVGVCLLVFAAAAAARSWPHRSCGPKPLVAAPGATLPRVMRLPSAPAPRARAARPCLTYLAAAVPELSRP